jgi:hypothetical protein
MPLNPEPPQVAGAPLPQPLAVPPSEYRWYHKFTALLFIVFCLEVGLFLLVFPWTESWDANFFSGMAAPWHRLWVNPYFRGAVSGLGVLNVYVSFLEIFRLRRFARR